MSREEHKDAIEVSIVFHEGQRMFAVPKQPAPVQPVAWARYPRYTGSIQKAEIVFTKPEGKDWLELYTTPRAAQRPRVGLTDEEVMQTMSGDWTSQFYFARAIEAKLKEKNT